MHQINQTADITLWKHTQDLALQIDTAIDTFENNGNWNAMMGNVRTLSVVCDSKYLDSVAEEDWDLLEFIAIPDTTPVSSFLQMEYWHSLRTLHLDSDAASSIFELIQHPSMNQVQVLELNVTQWQAEPMNFTHFRMLMDISVNLVLSSVAVAMGDFARRRLPRVRQWSFKQTKDDFEYRRFIDEVKELYE